MLKAGSYNLHYHINDLNTKNNVYGGREGSATKVATYNAACVVAYHNQAAAKLRLVAATLQYGSCQCRIVVAAKCSIHCNSVPYEFPNQIK